MEAIIASRSQTGNLTIIPMSKTVFSSVQSISELPVRVQNNLTAGFWGGSRGSQQASDVRARHRHHLLQHGQSVIRGSPRATLSDGVFR